MKHISRSTIVWGLRLTALMVMALQVWAIVSGAASLIEIMARMVIVAGCVMTIRAPRVGGAVVLLGCAVLSIAIYAWAGMLGAFGSAQLAFHTLPPMVIGMLYLTLPIREDQMQAVVAFEN